MREHLLSGPTMNYGFLPDSVPVNNLLERIAEDKKWSREDVESDIAILSKNRIVYVHDLRALSRESWTQIELLPLVKDLLRSTIDPDWFSNEKPGFNNSWKVDTISPNDDSMKKKDKKEKKKDRDGGKKKKDEKKKDKKKDKKGVRSTSLIGTPVIPTVMNGSSISPISQFQPQRNLQYNNNDTSSILSDSSLLSQDHLTVQNTIKNAGGGDGDGDGGGTGDVSVSPLMPNALSTLSLSSSSSAVTSSDEDEIMSPTRRKSVTFSIETAVGVAATEKTSVENDDKEQKKKEKKKDKKKKNKDAMASINNKNSGYSNFTSQPYTTHPVVKFRKMKMKHCKRLPEVPPDDLFLKGTYDRLMRSTPTATDS